MSQPPFRYRPPAAGRNLPPQANQPEPEYVGGPEPKGPRRKLWMLAAGAGAVLLLMMVFLLTSGDKQPAKYDQPVIRSVDGKSQAKPTSWGRLYQVGLHFGNALTTTIDSVKVSGLNKKEAEVRYQVFGPCGGWILDRRSWVLSTVVQGQGRLKEKLADEVKKTNVKGDSCTYDVTFHWPTAYINNSDINDATMMTVRMRTGARASTNINLWLQVPESHQGVGEAS